MKTTLRFCVPSIIILLVFLANLTWADTIDKSKYRPSAHGFPQIIQETDYNTIALIESLFTKLKRVGNGDISCEVSKDSIVLKPSDVSSAKIVIGAPTKGPVTIGGHSYKGKKEISLFTTMRKLLDELSKQRLCAGIKYDQFQTRAYEKRTILEFDFGPQIVVLEAFSNGPRDEERLYVLDLVDRNESYFWGK
ncbi:MAG: hypothetical protein ACLP9S_04745 [Syntrophales bacterium]